MASSEREFFLQPVRNRLNRSRLAIVFAERRWLVSQEREDWQTLEDAHRENTAAVRAMMQAQALVAA
jgi:hypothetical protein